MGQSLWDLKAAVYPLWRRLPPFRQILEHEITNCRRLMQRIQSPILVLDIGAGAGSTWRAFPDDTTIIALDRSISMVRQVTSRERVTPIVADACCLPVKSGQIRNISAIGLSEYIEDKEAWLKEIHLSLEPGGYFLVTTSPPSYWNGFRNILGNRIYSIHSEKWERITGQVGFKIVDNDRSLLQYQYLLLKI